MTIISASYKTDIPAFYGQWLRNRLNAGFCRMINPYNRRQHKVISLQKEDVDGFVFWTKNLIPFSDTLYEVYEEGYPFIVQYTINGYPRELESRVVDPERAIESFVAASLRYGPRAMVWRYDTVILSSLTDEKFHLDNFARLATSLEGHTDEVVISFLQLYSKTKRNMDVAARQHGFLWDDPTTETKRDLLSFFARIASERKMRLSLCTQPEFIVPGAAEARCVDASRLNDVAGRPISAKLQGMRPGCGCFKSIDIGDYDTCPHGCVYCYAVRNRDVALKRYREHDPNGEFLFPQNRLLTDGHEKAQLPLLPSVGSHPEP